MNNYSGITKLSEIDEACRHLRQEIRRKGEGIRDGISGIREFYSPTRLFASGLRRVWTVIPFNRLLLLAIERVKSLLSK